MPRPIDADALLKEIGELKKSPWYNGENGNYERIVKADAIGVVVDLCIKDAPTLDYAPVRHGGWIPWIEEVEIYHTGGFTERKQIGWLCSKCKKGRVEMHRRYCPDCGARMDAKEDAHG